MIVYRHADPRFPFLWESPHQPPARWHGPGEGPVQYLAGTPDGAWAEFLRHEGITTDSEVVNVRRALWAVEVPDDLSADAPRLPQSVLTGGKRAGCAVAALRAPSAALLPGTAGGWKVQGGLQPAAERDGTVLAAFAARPRPGLLARIRHL